MSAAADTAPEAAAPPTKAYRLYVLAILIVVYTFNFLDRQILGILAVPIKADLGLTDAQLGLMGGLAFALLYSTLGVPIAWLADRFSRTWIMTIALTVWSGFTALCGLAGSFTQLFLCRMGVGVGEAGGVAPAYSIISDYFPKHQQARALAAYSFGIPIGSAAGILFGGLIAAAIDWRMAFIVVGLAGVLLAPIFKLTVRDPRRGGYEADAPTEHPPAPAFRDVLKTLFPKKSFWLLSFGAASSSICGYGVAFWLPSFFQRSLGMSLVDTSMFYGALTLVGGVAGIWLGGALADHMGKDRRAYALVPAAAFLAALPFFVAAVNAQALWLVFLLFLVPTGLNLVWLGPVVTAIQHLVPPQMRSTASALFLLINNLLGIAVGLYFFGAVSDALAPQFGAESLRYAIYFGLGFYAVAAVLMYLASRTLPRDWVD